jgi:hypothetical protein
MFYRSIETGKEKRKPFRKAKAFDRSCRNHGSCKYCEENRLRQTRLIELKAREALQEYFEEKDYA